MSLKLLSYLKTFKNYIQSDTQKTKNFTPSLSGDLFFSRLSYPGSLKPCTHVYCINFLNILENLMNETSKFFIAIAILCYRVIER